MLYWYTVQSLIRSAPSAKYTYFPHRTHPSMWLASHKSIFFSFQSTGSIQTGLTYIYIRINQPNQRRITTTKSTSTSITKIYKQQQQQNYFSISKSFITSTRENTIQSTHGFFPVEIVHRFGKKTKLTKKKKK